MIIFEVLLGCHDILILGKSPIKWGQRPDMTIAVDWDAKSQVETKTNAELNKIGTKIVVFTGL